MTTTGSTSAREAPLGRDVLRAVRYYFRGWRGAAALAGIVAIAGIAFGWSWLVAAGIAPLLLSVLPCAAMCALGLCMNRLTGRQCSTDAPTQKDIGPVGSDDAAPRQGREVILGDACRNLPAARQIKRADEAAEQ